MPIPSRTTWTDDDGSGTTGTIINNAELQAIYDAVDGIESAVRTVGVNATVAITDRIIVCTAALTLTLYAAASRSGYPLRVVNNTAASDVTVQRAGTDLIRAPGGSDVTSVLVRPGQVLTIYCDGTRFFVW